jgi:ELWxxDGT repeat protein
MKPVVFLLSVFFLSTSVIAQGKIDVHDINPGSSANSQAYWPNMLQEINGRLYCIANDGIHGHELWCIDKKKGAFLVADVNPGKDGIYGSSPGMSLAKIAFPVARYIDSRTDDTATGFYFMANNGYSGNELFMCDSDNVVSKVFEFKPGSNGVESKGAFSSLAVLNNKIYIKDAKAYGIWEYDPLAVKARVVDTIKGNSTGGVTAFKNLLITNGNTPAYYYNSGKDTLIEFYPLLSGMPTSIWSISKSNFTPIGNYVYFLAENGALPNYVGYAYLWDGTNSPRLISKNTLNGAGTHDAFISYRDEVYFIGCEVSNGIGKLQKYNPATDVVTDLSSSGPAFYGVPVFVKVKDDLYFFASYDTIHPALYKYNGTSFSQVFDLSNAGFTFPANLPKFHSAYMPVYFNEAIYFVANGPQGGEVYKYSDAYTSISNAIFNGSINIYPNPSSANATVEINLQQSEKLAIRFTDVTGRQILQIPAKQYTAGKHNVDVNLSNYAAGTYYVSLLSSDGKMLYSSKLLKQ